MKLFGGLFGGASQRNRVQDDIRKVDRQVDMFFTESLKELQKKTDEIEAKAKEADERGKLAARTFEAVKVIGQAKVNAQIAGYGSYGALEKSRQKLADKRSKLLEAAKAKG